jgi:hypothetical protein
MLQTDRGHNPAKEAGATILVLHLPLGSVQDNSLLAGFGERNVRDPALGCNGSYRLRPNEAVRLLPSELTLHDCRATSGKVSCIRATDDLAACEFFA